MDLDLPGQSSGSTCAAGAQGIFTSSVPGGSSPDEVPANWYRVNFFIGFLDAFSLFTFRGGQNGRDISTIISRRYNILGEYKSLVLNIEYARLILTTVHMGLSLTC